MPAQPQTPRMQALQQLAGRLPVANQRVAQQQQAARDIQLQQAVRQAPPTAQAAQQMGAVQATNAGQQMIEQSKQNVQQQGQLGQMGLQEQQRATQSSLAGLQAGAREEAMDNEQRFAKISEAAKKEIFDQQMQFQRDESGRALWNDRQLLDYAAANARSGEQLKGYQQAATQAYERNVQMMEAANSKLQEALQQEHLLREQGMDQNQILELKRRQIDFQNRIAKAKADAANKTAMIGAIGTVAGGVAGGFAGGPAGAMAGAQLGGGLAGYAGGQVAGDEYESQLEQEQGRY